MAIAYTYSSQYANTQLPLPLATVASLTTCDNWNGSSCIGTASVMSYLYSGGFYYIAERDLRGFNYVKVTGPTGPNGEQAITETWFHQGNDVAVDTNNPNVAVGYTKGLPYRVKSRMRRGGFSRMRPRPMSLIPTASRPSLRRWRR